MQSKILPQISSKGANFLSAIWAIISTPKILSYGNNSGDITKRLFFDKATHKFSKDLDQHNLLTGNLADDLPGVLCTVTSQARSMHLAACFELIQENKHNFSIAANFEVVLSILLTMDSTSNFFWVHSNQVFDPKQTPLFT